jgi:hypothetical protein
MQVQVLCQGCSIPAARLSGHTKPIAENKNEGKAPESGLCLF